MIRNLCYAALLLALTSSCVSSKLYDDLQNKYKALQLENEELAAQLDGRETSPDRYTIAQLRKQVEELQGKKTQLAMELEATKNNYNRLKASYDALDANSSSALSENLQRNRTLLEQLEEKEKALAAEEARLQQMQRDLTNRSERIAELEGIIAAKDAKMTALKDAISAALTNFEGNGLTVEQRDGKVYVSMENKLLFDSGSWSVNARGQEAVEALGSVLAQNKEIAVLIEGHTDNVPYQGSGNLKGNWDLSTKRATAIVELLTRNAGIPKDNLTAAGRGEHAPVASNDSPEGRAKNRRIEVILAPKLDQINQLLNEL